MVIDGVIYIVMGCPNLGRECRASSAIEEAIPEIGCGLFVIEVIGKGYVNLLSESPPKVYSSVILVAFPRSVVVFLMCVAESWGD